MPHFSSRALGLLHAIFQFSSIVFYSLHCASNADTVFLLIGYTNYCLQSKRPQSSEFPHHQHSGRALSSERLFWWRQSQVYAVIPVRRFAGLLVAQPAANLGHNLVTAFVYPVGIQLRVEKDVHLPCKVRASSNAEFLLGPWHDTQASGASALVECPCSMLGLWFFARRQWHTRRILPKLFSRTFLLARLIILSKTARYEPNHDFGSIDGSCDVERPNERRLGHRHR